MSTLIQITKPTELIVNNTPIIGGVAGRVLFQGTGNVLQQSGNLFWDNTNGRLGIGTSSPPSILFLRNGPAPMFGIDTISSQTEIAVYNQATYQKALKIDGNGLFTWENGTAITPNNNGIYFSNTATTTPVRILGNPINTTIFHVTDNTGNTGLFMVKGATGNVLINTTTDAGYKFDVNGSARVSGLLSVNQINLGGTQLFLNQSSAPNSYLFSASTISILNGASIRLSGGSVSVNVTNNGAAADASAIFDVQSTLKGFLPPRMTTTQKNAIASPSAGLVVYDTDLNKLCVFTTTWQTITSV